MQTVIAFRHIARFRIAGRALLALVLAGCSATGGGGQVEGIGYREARYADLAAIEDYRACRDQALKLDGQARGESSTARYLASARLLQDCEAGLGAEASGVDPQERMRSYGLSIQNYLRGGDLVAARANLEEFNRAFPNEDLYYADGSSFTETMEILLGLKDRSAAGQFSTVNANETVKSELRRARYWQRN